MERTICLTIVALAGVVTPLSASAQDVVEAGASAPESSLIQVGGYVDVGLARAENGGKGFVFDTAGRFSDRYPGVAWILLGDPWATAINSRNEPADTTGSFAFQHDPVNSEGALTFLVNEIAVNVSATPLPQLFVFTSLDVMPRTGTRGSIGDYFDLDYAYVDWTPFEDQDITFTAGKFDSVFGREYRLRASPDRPGIVPSLLYRYVGGHPVGAKVRAKFFDKRLIVALAVANSSSMIETMSFSDDVDQNDLKTASGRVSYLLPMPFGGRMDLGLSGEAGAQGRQTDSSLLHWQWGFDVYAEWPRLELRGEFVRGLAPGGGVEEADLLDYRAFYAEAFARVLPSLGILARYEQRHAFHRHANEFLYLVHIQRAVIGLRYDPLPNVALKVEYVLNSELEPLPEFPNDVATSSLVVSF